jgi:hypothetical protein
MIADHDATMPVCGAENVYYDLDHGSPSYVGPVGPTSLSTLGVMYNSLIGSTTPQIVETSCSTGNCTFGTYQTLGLCSSCTNITDQIVYTRILTANSTSGPSVDIPSCPEEEYQSCGLRLADGLPNILASDYEMRMASTSHVLGPGLQSPAVGVPITTLTTPIRQDYEELYNHQNAIQSAAIQCTLYFCVYDVTSTVESGKLSEKMESVQVSITSDCVDDFDDGTRLKGPNIWQWPYNPTRNSCSIDIIPLMCRNDDNAQMVANRSSSRTPSNDTCRYTINTDQGLVLQNTIQPLLAGTVAKAGLG